MASEYFVHSAEAPSRAHYEMLEAQIVSFF